MSIFNLVSQSSENTVVTEYTPSGKRAESYQSEAQLEAEFIDLLILNGYERLTLTSEAYMIDNLRLQLENLNKYKFSDGEWKQFFSECLASPNEGIAEKSFKIQEDHVQILSCDDGTKKNIYLIDKKDIHSNKLQVLNQYETSEGNHANRYDVTILVNGLPLVHVELKRRGVAIREAFNQIERYQRDSFWSGSGLFQYVQIFVISNGTHTKYYSNTTRNSHINETQNSTAKKKSKRKSNSFEFTSYWADAKNKVIPDLVDFTKTFFAKHTILNILTRYSVFTSDKMLLVMRPYQIVATERIINKITIAHNYKKQGTKAAGGYIWHTTGSGKTLTSFKTAQLATALPFIDKVLFVVDRKDLDYQTMKEYDKFQKGAANSNTSTKVLEKQLRNVDTKIIITTIQKLSRFIEKFSQHEAFEQNIVIIFDECHRSQFGDMHKRITKQFKKYYLFGFTGTPIFAKNSGYTKNVRLRTTADAFGGEPNDKGDNVLPLHTYTIVDAINDKNVLPFRIDYIKVLKQKEGIKDSKVQAIDTDEALLDDKYITEVTKYILDHFDQKTKRNEMSYSFSALQNITEIASAKNRHRVKEIKQSVRLTGFNSIFAVSGIPAAMKYYTEFKAQLKDGGRALRIATIYSFAQNEEDPNADDINAIIEDEDFDTSKLDVTSRDFLDSAIADYNAMFGTNFDTSAEKFENYYKDLSLRVKNREVDLLIVVNMFLTGFDATTLNTLWVDKNLKYHGLIQAFSRTNRILNSIKTFGNIICFRNLQTATNDALALFGDKETSGIVILKDYNSYYYGYDEKGKHYPGYAELIAKLLQEFPLSVAIIGEQAQKDFIRLWGAILRIKNILSSFDDFAGNEILSLRDFQDYQSIYLDLYQEFKKLNEADKEKINDDIEFELELVKQVEVNIDYILMLVTKYHDSNCENKTILVEIEKAVNASMELRSKKELIEKFISRVNGNSHVEEDWQKFVEEQKAIELHEIVVVENLKQDETEKFISNAFRDGQLKTVGADIDKILPPISRFGGGRAEKKKAVIEKLKLFFEKFFGI